MAYDDEGAVVDTAPFTLRAQTLGEAAIDAALELASDVLSNKLCSEFWTLYFLDVDADWHVNDLFKLSFEFGHTCTTTTDHNTGFAGVDRNSSEVG